jgi:hypothetical protein
VLLDVARDSLECLINGTYDVVVVQTILYTINTYDVIMATPSKYQDIRPTSHCVTNIMTRASNLRWKGCGMHSWCSIVPKTCTVAKMTSGVVMHSLSAIPVQRVFSEMYGKAYCDDIHRSVVA